MSEVEEKEFLISDRRVAQLRKDLENEDLRMKLGTRKASIFAGNGTRGRCVELWKRSHGRIDIKICGTYPVLTTRTEKCDLGHSHNVIDEEVFVWGASELCHEERVQLAEWLLEEK